MHSASAQLEVDCRSLAKRNCRRIGIERRILSSAVRNSGVERAVRVARHAAESPYPNVVGFSMAGDQAGFPKHDFAEGYEVAAEAGLGSTIDAEWAGADSMRAALELPIKRISHPERAIERPVGGGPSWRRGGSCSSAA